MNFFNGMLGWLEKSIWRKVAVIGVLCVIIISGIIAAIIWGK